MITDNLGHFGDKLAHFPMYKDFVAIVEPTDTASKSTIKRLENPRHDQLSAERLISEAEQKSVRLNMNVLKKWIRESIRSEAFVPPVQETTLEEMNEFFGDVSKADRIPDPNGGDPNPLAITYKPTKTKKSPVKLEGAGDEEEEGGGGGTNDSSGGNRSGKGAGKGSSTGGSGGGEDLAILDFRNVPDAANPDQCRTLFFTPLNSGRAQLSICAKGMNDDVYFSKSKFNDEGGELVGTLTLEKGVRRKITVEFATPYRGPISMKLIAAPTGGSHEAK